MSRGAELVRIEREARRCCEDADRCRQKLLALTSFRTPGELALLGDNARLVEIRGCMADFENCIRRAIELETERTAVAAE